MSRTKHERDQKNNQPPVERLHLLSDSYYSSLQQPKTHNERNWVAFLMYEVCEGVGYTTQHSRSQPEISRSCDECEISRARTNVSRTNYIILFQLPRHEKAQIPFPNKHVP